MLKKIILTALIMLAVAGCKPDPNNLTPKSKELTELLAINVEGMYVNSSPRFIYEEAIHQIVINPTKLIYRIQTDDLNSLLQCKLSSRPAQLAEQTVMVVQLRVTPSVSPQTYTVTLEKQTDSKMWLWEESSKTGFIVTL